MKEREKEEDRGCVNIVQKFALRDIMRLSVGEKAEDGVRGYPIN